MLNHIYIVVHTTNAVTWYYQSLAYRNYLLVVSRSVMPFIHFKVSRHSCFVALMKWYTITERLKSDWVNLQNSRCSFYNTIITDLTYHVIMTNITYIIDFGLTKSAHIWSYTWESMVLIHFKPCLWHVAKHCVTDMLICIDDFHFTSDWNLVAVPF